MKTKGTYFASRICDRVLCVPNIFKGDKPKASWFACILVHDDLCNDEPKVV